MLISWFSRFLPLPEPEKPGLRVRIDLNEPAIVTLRRQLITETFQPGLAVPAQAERANIPTATARVKELAEYGASYFARCAGSPHTEILRCK
jgi:hypothetical protein